jgi:hypothetical protein
MPGYETQVEEQVRRIAPSEPIVDDSQKIEAEMQMRKEIEAEIQMRKEIENGMRKELEDQALKQAEQNAKFDAELRARNDAAQKVMEQQESERRAAEREIQLRKEIEVDRKMAELKLREEISAERKVAEQMLRKVIEAEMKTKAAEQEKQDNARRAREAEQQARKEAEQARKEAEQAKKEVELKQRQEAMEAAEKRVLMREAEARIREQIKEELRREAAEQAREERRREAEMQRAREVEKRRAEGVEINAKYRRMKESEEVMDDASTMIQTRFRGGRARKRTQAMKGGAKGAEVADTATQVDQGAKKTVERRVKGAEASAGVEEKEGVKEMKKRRSREMNTVVVEDGSGDDDEEEAAVEVATREAEKQEVAKKEAAEEKARKEAAEEKARKEVAEEKARKEVAEEKARKEAAEEKARKEAAEEKARKATSDERQRQAKVEKESLLAQHTSPAKKADGEERWPDTTQEQPVVTVDDDIDAMLSSADASAIDTTPQAAPQAVTAAATTDASPDFEKAHVSMRTWYQEQGMETDFGKFPRRWQKLKTWEFWGEVSGIFRKKGNTIPTVELTAAPTMANPAVQVEQEQPVAAPTPEAQKEEAKETEPELSNADLQKLHLKMKKWFSVQKLQGEFGKFPSFWGQLKGWEQYVSVAKQYKKYLADHPWEAGF